MAKENKNKNELIITRIFDAPSELVWRAWTNPEMMKKWWGPKIFTAPTIKIDFRVGGKYLYCMRDPEGKNYWSTGIYREIVPMKKIVATDSFADEKGNVVSASYYGMQSDFPMEMTVIIAFEEQKGKTKMTLRHVGMPTGQMEEMAGQSWNESFDKLVESLK